MSQVHNTHLQVALQGNIRALVGYMTCIPVILAHCRYIQHITGMARNRGCQWNRPDNHVITMILTGYSSAKLPDPLCRLPNEIAMQTEYANRICKQNMLTNMLTEYGYSQCLP